MGKKAKTSRKGKKAWRANISSEEVDDFFSSETKDALSGGPLTHAPDDSLFFLDKQPDLSVKKKIEKHKSKVLHFESLLKRNEFVEPVPSSKRKKVLKEKKKKKTKYSGDVEGTQKSTGKSGSESGKASSELTDLWDNKEVSNVSSKKKSNPSCIPAVEVEPPGCSFNPSFEAHQDALAVAVAGEMQKLYQKELGPEPVPVTVPGRAIDEEEMYFLDGDIRDDDEGDENADKDVGEACEGRPVKIRRVTRPQLNRRARRKEQLKAESEAKKKESATKEIDSLPDIMREIEEDEKEKQKRQLMRAIAMEEKKKTCPPCFGRHKFEPAPMQVLLSEELSGSLRKLKPCSTLTRDRFKSLEKRGLIVPGPKHKRK